ncbi:MAG: carbohydrate kinase [Chitinophagia bacterium]|nr:carbohydrate kinase [Chitinophagia bacterium]
MTNIDIQKLFDQMQQLHVVVVGDVMLDNYWWGQVERISPEAPVPIVALHQKESRLGGAANVAVNCKALGARVTLASVVGEDMEGDQLIKLAEQAGMETSLLLKSKLRPTTTKVRVISRNQQMLRLDDESTADLFTEEEHPFINAVLKYLQIEKPQVVVFEDYNKGVLKQNVIQKIIAHSREIGAVTAVDPKMKNFLEYKGVTIFKPNLKEVREGLNIKLELVDVQHLTEVHRELQSKLDHEVTFITLSEKGVFYNNNVQAAIIPSHIRNIADVSGAGDTVIATAAMVYALTTNVELMAEISNLAGGLVCEEVGVVPINKSKLMQEMGRVMQP